MAQKHKNKKGQKVQKKEVLKKPVVKEEGFFEALSTRVKIGESYTSLLLGIIVVVVVTVLVVSFVKTNASKNPENQKLSGDDIEMSLDEVSEKDLPTTYTVEEGDTLSIIAQKVYGLEDYWVEIAQENALTSPDNVPVGTKIKLPKIVGSTSKVEVETTEEQGEDKITGSTYVVKEGDLIWDIAERAYGDGNRWTEIVNANNIPNPDVIEPGTKLVIPR